MPTELADRSGRRGRFAAMMDAILAENPFQRKRLAAAGFPEARPPRLEDLPDLPLLTKAELVADQAGSPPFGTNLTFPLDRYVRVHQTSGTSGEPLRWLDTVESWSWFLDCWKDTYEGAGVTAEDRVLVAFSFGPYIGFWAAFGAGERLGAMMIPAGGLGTAQRVDLVRRLEPTALLCTPTYALRLAEEARTLGVDLTSGSIVRSIHGGEPGASFPSVRSRLEAALGARVFDHAGSTETGPWGYPCEEGGLHVNEREFVVEVVDPATGGAAAPDATGERAGELVVTNLGRVGSPVVRFRTGDAVVLAGSRCPCGRDDRLLRGGLLGRVDDMIVVRGVNVFPGAIEDLVRGVPEVVEFGCDVTRDREMAELVLEIEVVDGTAPEEVADRIATLLHRRLGLRAAVSPVAAGSLPRFETKARRFRFT